MRLLLLLLLLAVSACQCDAPFEPPPVVVEAAPSPVRRLTEEELNRTLADLFPGVPLPPIDLTEDPGKDFAQDNTKQPVSELNIEQTRAGIIAVTAAIFADHDPRQDGEEDVVVDAIVRDLLPRAFRRAVLEEEAAAYVNFYLAQKQEHGFVPAYQLVLQAILQSPAFLYRLELDTSGDIDDLGRVPVSSTEMASRLSYFLWGSTPDQELLDLAVAGELLDEDVLSAQADRLLADPRAMDAILSFHRQWLDFDRVLQTNKSPQRFPQYNEFLRGAMRAEADAFIELVFASDAKLRTLLTSRQTRLIPALGPVYGVDVDFDNQEVELPAERSGILTQAQFLAARGHAVEGSPVLRGVFVLEKLVCEAPPPPDGNIDTTPPQPEEDGAEARTNRQRYQQHEDDPVCAGCHIGIDGIGFGLEGFDSMGQFRTTDNGLPVDDSGSLDGTRIGGTFNGAAELGQQLADSAFVQNCVARHWFRFANGRREELNDEKELTTLTSTFTDADGDIRVLLRAIVLSEAFRLRRVQ